MSKYYFVPPGHQSVMGIKVMAAFPHASGAWLSFQPVGPAIALVWRASDSWSATAMLAGEVCTSLSREENLDGADELAKYLLSEGPPEGLLRSAERSRLERANKAKRASLMRWAKQRGRQSNGRPSKKE